MKNKIIKSLTGREVLLFLFFVLVSCCLWLMLTLNQDYETDLKFKISVKDIPEDVSFSSMDEELIVRVKDHGTVLMNYMMGTFLPVSVEYKEFVRRNGRPSLPASALQKSLRKQLNSTTSILAIAPDTIVCYTQESAVKFPVRLNSDIHPAKQYAVGTVTVEPDSVWVFAPRSVIDTMNCVYTRHLALDNLRETKSVSLPLVANGDVNCNPSSVNVTVSLYPYTQKEIEVPVTGIDFPEMYSLQAVPSRVKVKVNVNVENFDDIQPDDFEVGVSYTDIYGSDSHVAELRLLRAPEGIGTVKIVPATVEYIIEQR